MFHSDESKCPTCGLPMRQVRVKGVDVMRCEREMCGLQRLRKTFAQWTQKRDQRSPEWVKTAKRKPRKNGKN